MNLLQTPSRRRPSKNRGWPDWPGIAVCAAALLLIAAQKPELRFLTSTDLPNLGLKIRVMPTAKESPLPPPTTYTYSFKAPGTDERKVEMYSPGELWLKEQHAGRWVDDFGNILTLATAKYPPPQGFKRQHVTREEYQKRIEEIRGKDKEIDWKQDDLIAWVAAFTGATEAKPEVIVKPPFTLRQLIRVHLSGPPSKLIAYLFQLNRSAAGQSRASQEWYAVFVQVSGAIPVENAIKAIDQNFFQSLTSSRTTTPQAVGPSTAFQTPGAAALAKKINRSPEFLTSREQVVNSVKNMSDWWFVETENYIILSDMTTRYRAMVNELQNSVELMRDAYEQFMPPRKEITAVSVIRVFASPEQYEGYVGPTLAWTAGVWMPPKKELVIKPSDWGGSREQKARVMRVTFHEAFHQYIFYAMDQIESAPWFNEGHASFYEVASISDRNLSVGENEQLAGIVEKVVKDGNFSIVPILTMDLRQFYSGTQESRQVNYAMAWGVVYYLRKWAPIDKSNTAYAGVLQKYTDALWTTKECRQATERAFDGIDLKKFQADFVKFWSNRNMRSSARQNKIFRDYSTKGR